MKLFLTLLFSVLTIFSFGQKLNTLDKPKVDERIELLSIVFRLANSKEYSSNAFKLYTDKIESHYNPYKEHELIQFIKKVRYDNGIGYDAVMSMAIHLDDKLNPLFQFTDKKPDPRWGKDNANEFVRLLKLFYKDSNSEQFFKENQILYSHVSKSFLPIYEQLDLNWYTKFYGKEPNEKFVIINGLGNGGGSYGPSVDLPNSKREVYAIMGTWLTDSLGNADFKMDSYFPILLHEFNHSFVNYLLDKNPEPFKNNGEILFKALEVQMKSQAYSNWQTMINEALVRAAVIKYMKDHDFSSREVNQEIIHQRSLGFLWIEDLVLELENYDKNRNKYPTLESYLPKLIKAYDKYAGKIDVYIEEFDKMRPNVVSINEFNNGDQNVNHSLKSVTINFDKPLLGKGYSINYGTSKEHFPVFKKISYSNDNKSIILELELKENKNYDFVLTGSSFKSLEGISIKDYKISFKTDSSN